MDVLNADELEFNIGVVVFVFIAFPRRPVGDRVQLHQTFQNISFLPFFFLLKIPGIVRHKCQI